MDDSRRVDRSENIDLRSPARGGGSESGRGQNLRRTMFAVTLSVLILETSGCSLFVMAGKMVFGDPLTASAFTQATGVNLVKDDKRVVVLCSVPEFANSGSPALDLDLVDAISVQLRRNGVNMVSQNEVANWIENQGGLPGDAADIASQAAGELKTDYILHVNVENFSIREENSSDLFRGRTVASVTGFAVTEVDGLKQALQIFTRDFKSVYPAHHPVSAVSISERAFRKRYFDRIGVQLSHMFYDHRIADEME